MKYLHCALIAAMSGALLMGCDRFEDTTPVDGKPPSDPDGYWNATWTIAKSSAVHTSVSCSDAGARSVTARIRSAGGGAPRAYRIPCEASAGWLPIQPGDWRVSADLIGEDGRVLSSIPEYPMSVKSKADRRRTPMLFKIK